MGAEVRVETSTLWTGHFANSGLTHAGWRSERGLGVRVLTPDESRYRYTTGRTREDIDGVVAAAGRGSMPVLERSGRAAAQQESGRRAPADGEPDPGLLSVLEEVDRAARAYDPRVVQVRIAFEYLARSVTLGSLELGVDVDHRDLTYLTVRAVAREGTAVAVGHFTPGAPSISARLDGFATGREAAQRAVDGLSARPAPVGRFPVVIGPGRGMVMVHEACCHPLEADEILRGSIYAGRVGEAVASPLVSIVDDPTLESAIGRHAIDDEHTAGRPTPLIEEGRLVGYLSDRLTAARTGTPVTANGRAQTFRDHPLPRMTNTCVRAGTARHGDIIADTPLGIFAQHVGGGQVVEATGEFVFRILNGYVIRDGRICEPITETSVAGKGSEVLLSIDAVGDTAEIGAAKCGKAGQLVPVGVVGPMLRVRSLLIGGVD
jgi:TldD protein